MNGKRAVRAKSPNTGFYFLKDVSETILEEGTGRAPELACQKFTLFADGTEQLASFLTEDFGEAVITFYHKWDNTRKHITGFEADSSAIFTIGQGMKPWNRIDKKNRYTLENYRAALDTCGEWYLDRSGYLYYIPQPGETIEKTTAIAPVSSQFIVLKGNAETGEKVKHICFEGLSLQVSGYKMPTSGNEPAQAAFPVEASVMADFAENIRFTNCEKHMQDKNLFKKYTLRGLLDELDVIECFMTPGKDPFIGEVLQKQQQIYIDMGVKNPVGRSSLCI